jgi:C-terminal processing protease CtpA/Prc
VLAERKDRPLFIGQPTMGSTGSPLVLRDFPENVLAKICTRRVLYPYSLKPFNEGIRPDIPVEYTFDEYMRDDYDKEVETAIKEIDKQLSTRPL